MLYFFENLRRQENKRKNEDKNKIINGLPKVRKTKRVCTLREKT